MKKNFTKDFKFAENRHSVYELEMIGDEIAQENSVENDSQSATKSSYVQVFQPKMKLYAKKLKSFFESERKNLKLFLYAWGVFVFYLLYSILQEEIV